MDNTNFSNNIPVEVQESLSVLNYAISTTAITQKQVSKATGVDQSQISRILSGQILRVSGNVKKLCKYAENLSPKDNHFETTCEQRVVESALRLWNGTPDHAELLGELFKQLHRLQLVEKRQ